MDKTAKQKIVDNVKEKLSKANGLYITDFNGLTVAETNELRGEFFEAEVDYSVVKNTLLKRAFTEDKLDKYSNSLESILETLKGPTGVIFAYNDPVSPAKIIKKHFDKIEKPKLKIAVIEDVAYDSRKLNELASLPSKPELIASIIGSIHAPISGIVHSINAVIVNLASVIEEVAKKNQK